jgi:hypothetical protein
MRLSRNWSTRFGFLNRFINENDGNLRVSFTRLDIPKCPTRV